MGTPSCLCLDFCGVVGLLGLGVLHPSSLSWSLVWARMPGLSGLSPTQMMKWTWLGLKCLSVLSTWEADGLFWLKWPPGWRQVVCPPLCSPALEPIPEGHKAGPDSPPPALRRPIQHHHVTITEELSALSLSARALNRNTTQATFVTSNFLVATFKKAKTGKIDFNSIFYLVQYIQITVISTCDQY